MSYFVYFLIVVWYLSALGNFVAGALVLFGPPQALKISPKPAWFLFASAVYTLIVATVLVWLYRTDVLTEWWMLLAGTVIFLPEMFFLLKTTLGKRA